MNTVLFDFYQGIGTDNRGRSIEDMLAMSDLELERSHDIVQWLFPLKEISRHNRAAPLLDDPTIVAMKSDECCLQHSCRAGQRFWKFLVQDYVDHPTWIKKKDHNFLRLTRIIKFYKLLEDPLAETFFTLAKSYYDRFPEIIGTETLSFWNEALCII